MGHVFKNLFMRPRQMQYRRLHQISNEYGTPQGSPTPKGFLAVVVGTEGEQKKRFLLPLAHLNHPLIQQFLVDAEEEFGCCYEDLITLPCDACKFRKAMDMIVRSDLHSKKLHGFPKTQKLQQY